MASLQRELIELEDKFVLGELLESDYQEKKLELLQQLRDAGETVEQTSITVQEINDSRNVPFCLIPPGGFYFGPDDNWKDLDCSFYMSKYSVTVREFREFLDDSEYDYSDEDRQALGLVSPDDDCPASHVSYDDAKEFCRWLRRETGEYYSLPHEVEWEYAARGNDARHYPWGNTAPDNDVACFQGNVQYDCTVPVFSFEERNKSPFGLVDMVGNVWEWCLDTFDDERDPHILRGGSWCNDQEYANALARTFSFPPTKRIDYGGFRIIHLPGDMLTEYRAKYAERGAAANLKVVSMANKKKESSEKSSFSALGKALESAAAAATSQSDELAVEEGGEVNDAMAMAISSAASTFLRKEPQEDAGDDPGLAIPMPVSSKSFGAKKPKENPTKEDKNLPPGVERPQYKSIEELRKERGNEPAKPKGPQLEFEEQNTITFEKVKPLEIPPALTLASVIVWFALLAGIIIVLGMRLTDM